MRCGPARSIDRARPAGPSGRYPSEFLYEIGGLSRLRPRVAARATGKRIMTHSALTFDGEGRQPTAGLIDPFGRAISYLRVSVTDRCDFRCVYCMAENMTFLPKADLLTLEELDRLCSAFIAKGVRKLRLTGGEPLVRRGIMTLFASLSRHLDSGALDELTLTTNGSQLPKYAAELVAARREAHQRVARHARRRQVPRRDPLGRTGQGPLRHRCRASGRPQGQDQCGRAQGRERGRDRIARRPGRTGAAWSLR